MSREAEKHMNAIRFHEFGKPLDVLAVEEIPTPEPGSGEVRVRLTNRPIHHADLHTVRGVYGQLPKLPAAAGMEGMGLVDMLGEGVEGVVKGQRVIPLAFDGTWGEYVVVTAQNLIPVPEQVSDESAAQFIINPVTAWVMLTETLGLKKGDWVLQSAAGSTVGRIVLQLAQAKGYKTINLVRRHDQVQKLLDLGADAVICTADEDVVSRIRELTEDQGAHGALDAVGGETGAQMVSALRPGATMVVYGGLSGMPIPLKSREMIFRGTAVRSFWIPLWFQSTPPDRVSTTLMELMQLIAQGRMTPPVEAKYSLDKFREAILHVERQGRSGKVLLTN
ncbi:MAG: zinc-dependent alcohol dehydrogenase family protein [Nitrospiraceae bacterium]